MQFFIIIEESKKNPVCLSSYVVDDLFVFSPCQVTRGHAFKLFKRQNTHCVRANFFSERVINCWNSLLDSVDFSSFTTFRRTVKQVDFFQDFSDINFVLSSML